MSDVLERPETFPDRHWAVAAIVIGAVPITVAIIFGNVMSALGATQDQMVAVPIAFAVLLVCGAVFAGISVRHLRERPQDWTPGAWAGAWGFLTYIAAGIPLVVIGFLALRVGDRRATTPSPKALPTGQAEESGTGLQSSRVLQAIKARNWKAVAQCGVAAIGPVLRELEGDSLNYEDGAELFNVLLVIRRNHGIKPSYERRTVASVVDWLQKLMNVWQGSDPRFVDSFRKCQYAYLRVLAEITGDGNIVPAVNAADSVYSMVSGAAVSAAVASGEQYLAKTHQPAG